MRQFVLILRTLKHVYSTNNYQGLTPNYASEGFHAKCVCLQISLYFNVLCTKSGIKTTAVKLTN